MTATDTKLVRDLRTNDQVVTFGDTTFNRPFTVTSATMVTVKGKTFAAIIRLEGGRFWPTGHDDPRTCTVIANGR